MLASKVAGAGTLHDIDQPVLDWLVRHRGSDFTTAMKVVSVLASTTFVIPLVLIAGAVLWLVPAAGPPTAWRRLRPALLLGAAWAGAWILGDVMRGVVARPRPPLSVHLVAVTPGRSHPAMPPRRPHSTAAPPPWPRRRRRPWRAKVAAWAGAFLLIGAIGFSRLYLGVHWLTDVLGGYALGAVWLGLLLTVARAVSELRTRSGNDRRRRCATGPASPRAPRR